MDGGGAVAEVPAAADGERLDRFVALVTGCSRSEVSRRRRGRGVGRGSPVTKASTKLVAGQVVSLHFDPLPESEPVTADEDVVFGVVHADSSLIVVDKPAGLVVHPAPGHRGGTLCNGLLARFADVAGVGDPARPGIVHRLDRMTSGLLVVARTSEAHGSLVAQLADHSVDRGYTAVVLGHPGANTGVVDAPIGRSRRNPMRMTVAVGAKDAPRTSRWRSPSTIPIVRSWGAVWRPDGHTRSGSTWHRSAIPWLATTSMAVIVPALGCPGCSSMRPRSGSFTPLRVSMSSTLAPAARPRRVARDQAGQGRSPSVILRRSSR
ncbi:MAG: RluA family pseudouridine synthase [Microthrixaceae bacterium]|nr:RluA family pseudouridine synthase [Microthrixaceae bacterium]